MQQYASTPLPPNAVGAVRYTVEYQDMTEQWRVAIADLELDAARNVVHRLDTFEMRITATSGDGRTVVVAS